MSDVERGVQAEISDFKLNKIEDVSIYSNNNVSRTMIPETTKSLDTQQIGDDDTEATNGPSDKGDASVEYDIQKKELNASNVHPVDPRRMRSNSKGRNQFNNNETDYKASKEPSLYHGINKKSIISPSSRFDICDSVPNAFHRLLSAKQYICLLTSELCKYGAEHQSLETKHHPKQQKDHQY